MTEPILFDIDSNHVATLTVNRPEVRNALDWAAMEALGAAVERAAETPDLRALILTGAGTRAFISGGDVRSLHSHMTEEDGLRQHDLMSGILERLAALPAPVIAALEGATRGGGCEVALACDLRVMSEDATISFAQVAMGVTPGWGSAGRLIGLIGYARAMDVLLTGRVMEADEALAMGLVNRIAEPGEALKMARHLAERIANGPLLAVQGIKHVLFGHLTLTPDAARARERSTFARLWASGDHAEASAAFLEKRPPEFRGQ